MTLLVRPRLDSSLLLMPLQGFIAPRPDVAVHAVHAGRDGPRAYLRQPGLPVQPTASPDGLAGDKGTFSPCTFWYVDALARAGRLEEARLTFEKMFTYANHLGLYSEEIGSTGEQLDDFPQAFSHLSLISAAVNLETISSTTAPGRWTKPRRHRRWGTAANASVRTN